MAHKFVKTVQGPVIQGEDEILFFSQFQEMVDYHDEDPNFLADSKKFLAEGLKSIAADIADAMFVPVVGGDQTRALYGYMDAIRSMGEFEYRFLPSLNPQQWVNSPHA